MCYRRLSVCLSVSNLPDWIVIRYPWSSKSSLQLEVVRIWSPESRARIVLTDVCTLRRSCLLVNTNLNFYVLQPNLDKNNCKTVSSISASFHSKRLGENSARVAKCATDQVEYVEVQCKTKYYTMIRTQCVLYSYSFKYLI